MRLTAIIPHSTTVAIAVTLLLGAALAQEEPAGPPPLILQPGTILTARIDQALSSEHNQAGDLFSGSLTQPVVVQGIVVSQRGQTVAGRVVEAKKAGRISGVSQLRIRLTSLTLVDGQNVPIQTQLLVQRAPTSAGRDVATVGGTTALGALVGAAAGWGKGAAIGAGAGAAAGTIGVLLTRGYATVVYPETMLTFQITAPVAIDTSNVPQAFHGVNPASYAQTSPPPAPPAVAPTPAVATPAYPYPYPYPYDVYYAPFYYRYYAPPYYPYVYRYYGYPYFYGPAFSFAYGYPYYHAYRYYRYPGRYVHHYAPRPAPHHGGVVGGGHGGKRH